MAKIRYDVTDVETRSGDQAQPGTYTVQVAVAEHRTTKNDGTPANDIRLQLNFVDDDYMPLFPYVGLGETAQWKLKEFTKALGLKDKGELDTDKLIGKKLRVKVTASSYNGDYQARAGTFLPLRAEDEDSASSSQNGDVSYEEWSIEDLKGEIDQRGLDTPKGRLTEAKLIQVLEEDDAATAGGDGGEPADDDPYDGWSAQDFKDEITSRGIDLPKGRITIDKLRDILTAADGDGEGEPGEAPADDYDQWEVDDFKAEFADRQLDLPKGRLTKERLIATLREDDATDPLAEAD